MVGLYNNCVWSSGCTVSSYIRGYLIMYQIISESCAGGIVHGELIEAKEREECEGVDLAFC